MSLVTLLFVVVGATWASPCIATLYGGHVR